MSWNLIIYKPGATPEQNEPLDDLESVTRLFISILVFVGSLVMTTIVCTWGWEALIKDRLYYCTDDTPLDYLQPGSWVHNPVAVQRVVGGRSMSEPDTIKTGWSVRGLWMLWGSFVGGSVFVSLFLAWLPWINGGRSLPERGVHAASPPARQHTQKSPASPCVR
jgi:hypothetical protein